MSGGLRTNFCDCLLKGCTALFFFLSGFSCLQGLYGSWKTLNFIVTTPGLVKSWKKVAGPGKFLKSVTLKYKNMKCIAGSKEN